MEDITAEDKEEDNYENLRSRLSEFHYAGRGRRGW